MVAVAEEEDVCGIVVVDVYDGAVSEYALGVVPPEVVPNAAAVDGTGEDAFDSEEVALALVSGKIE